MVDSHISVQNSDSFWVRVWKGIKNFYSDDHRIPYWNKWIPWFYTVILPVFIILIFWLVLGLL